MVKKKSAVHDMTVGSPLKTLLIFTVPIFLGQLLQQFYSVTDMKVIGMDGDGSGIAAINSIGSLYGIMIGIANGLNNGCAIVVARLFGAKNYSRMRVALASMLSINVVTSLLFSVFGLCFTEQLMTLMEVPENVASQARVYLIFILCGILPTVMYNMCASILRAVGDSRTPLYFLIISCVINILLDLLFVLVLEWGVGGAAAATIIAQITSAMLCFILIVKRRPELHFGKQDFVFDKELLKELISLGLSMGLITSLVSFGSAALSRATNRLAATLGSDMLTATGAARKIDGFFMMPLSTLGTALSTFVSQNRGAGRFDRIRQAIRGSFFLGACWCLLAVATVYLFGDGLITFITSTNSDTVVELGVEYMRINVLFFAALMVLQSFRSVLQGFGFKLVPIVTAAAELVIKFSSAELAVPRWGFIGVCFTEPIIWAVAAVIVAAVYVKNMRFFELSTKNAQ